MSLMAGNLMFGRKCRNRMLEKVTQVSKIEKLFTALGIQFYAKCASIIK